MGTKSIFKCSRCGYGTYLTKWDIIKKPCPKCDGNMGNDVNGIIQDLD
jgi:Zn finger protein HypA/HybF involved in hydrogenase expression